MSKTIAHVTIAGTRIGLDLSRKAPSCEISTWDFSEVSAVSFWDHSCAREIRDDIIRLAIEKRYGKRCFWWADSGLGWNYGQVMQALRATKRNSNPGNSSVTSRVSLKLEINGVEI